MSLLVLTTDGERAVLRPIVDDEHLGGVIVEDRAGDAVEHLAQRIFRIVRDDENQQALLAFRCLHCPRLAGQEPIGSVWYRAWVRWRHARKVIRQWVS